MKRSTAATIPFISFDLGASVPYYQQVYEGFRAAILSGWLRPGQQMPSTRALAVELGVSRLPVVTAYEQLVHEGYFEGRPGAGTFVAASIPDELTSPVAAPAPGPVAKPPRPNLPANERGLAPFRVSLPALDRFPHSTWSRLVARHARGLTAEMMAYGDPAGLPSLREAIAEYLRRSRAVRCDAGQILVVSGSQMALQLCATALLGRADAVCVEEPGYRGARDALTATGATLRPAMVDEHGIDVAALEGAGAAARAVYVTPSHQYPLGTSMTAARRLELLEWAQRGDRWVLEDDYDSEFRYASRPLGALQGMDTAERVVYVGTFSKVLFPSLRIGYLVVPRPLQREFLRAREALDIFPPTLYQLALADFIQEGHFARHLRRMRAVYLGRRDALVGALRDYLGELLEPVNADAGLHLATYLPDGFDDLDVVRRGARAGVNASPLSACYAGGAPRHGLILGFGGATERRIRLAAKRLRDVLLDAG